MALDVGEVRIGVAVANDVARFAAPLTTIEHNEHIEQTLKQLFKEHDVTELVVGLPRSLSGDDTAQTIYVRQFVEKIPHGTIRFQDEALTSRKAEQELKQRGKPYSKGDIDALAATYILEDYLASNK